MDQNSALKKEAGIAERKLLARNERIQNLEALLQDADRRLAMQNQKFEAQLQAVKERLDQARGKNDIVSYHCPGLRQMLGFSPKGGDFLVIKLWPDRQASARRRRERSRRDHERRTRVPKHGEPFGTSAGRGLWVCDVRVAAIEALALLTRLPFAFVCAEPVSRPSLFG